MGTGGLALGGGQIYFAVTEGPGYTVRSVSTAGGSPTTLATQPSNAGVAGGSLRGLSVDTSLVYWLDVGNAALRSVPIAGGSVVTLAGNLDIDLNRQPDLVLAAGVLYWTERGSIAGCCLVGGSGSVRSIPAGGGLISTVQSGLDAPTGLAVDAAGNVVWTEAWRVARRAAGGAQTIAAGIATRNARIAVDNANIYVLDGDYIKRVPLTGGMPENLAWAHDASLGDFRIVNQDIATDGVNVYWTEGPTPNVHSVPVAGGMPVTLNAGDTGGSRQECFWRIAVNGGNVYWSSGSPTVSLGCAVKTVPITGGTVATLVDVPYFEDFTVDDTRLYYAELGTNPGSIRSVPLGGGSAETLVTDVAVDVLTHDAQYVYWLDFSYARSGIYRIAKTGAPEATPLFAGLNTDPRYVHDAILVEPGIIYFSQASNDALLSTVNP
jgi:hypothetical protein